MNHWALSYIGLPWKYGASGPEEYDCWGFVREIQRSHFQLELPEIDYGPDWHTAADNLDRHPEKRNWVQVVDPSEGDVVMLARSRLPVHIGVYITANAQPGVLHCLQGTGVIFQPLATMRMSGWGSLKFYRHI